MTTSMESQPTSCVSCGALLSGTYCSQCGEETLNREKRTLRYFFGNTVVSELFNVDGKIRRTLNLLLARPGFLAAEFIAGRRRPYINSLRMLIITIIVFAITMNGTNLTLSLPFGDFNLNLNMVPSPIPAGGSVEGVLYRSDPYGVIERMLERKLGVPVAEIPAEAGTSFKETLSSLATPLSFTVVLLLALVLFLLFNRRRPLFVEHLIFTMNYYSFLLITAMLASAVATIGRLLPFVFFLMLVIPLWQIVYLTIAVRRFYLPDARRMLAWPTSIGVALLLLIFSGVFITSVQMASGAVAVWLL